MLQRQQTHCVRLQGRLWGRLGEQGHLGQRWPGWRACWQHRGQQVGGRQEMGGQPGPEGGLVSGLVGGLVGAACARKMVVGKQTAV